MVGLVMAAVQLFLIAVASLILAMAGWFMLRLLHLKRASSCAVLAPLAGCLVVWAYVSIWGFTWFG